ncbi:hypothetical protein [Demequina aestuarii]|uniref:hypothetical protein n=1 Tax=Demequina aestuarii TaxID=327095 RepID=UPI0007828DA6|nr:hypothetical protein [Demequina aestuarii]
MGLAATWFASSQVGSQTVTLASTQAGGVTVEATVEVTVSEPAASVVELVDEATRVRVVETTDALAGARLRRSARILLRASAPLACPGQSHRPHSSHGGDEGALR